MSTVNPDPHADGYLYEPARAVTANFPAAVDVPSVRQALADAGFGPEQTQVFVGAAGATQLDLKGERRGGWVEFRRTLERMYTETKIFDRIDRVLESGGALVVAFTEGDGSRKARAAEVLKSHGGEHVWYWGDLITENL